MTFLAREIGQCERKHDVSSCRLPGLPQVAPFGGRSGSVLVTPEALRA